jgi:LysM repeat protein
MIARGTIVIVLFGLLLAAPTTAHAWYSCGDSYLVQRGDSLSSIARDCGTTVAALKLANPGMGYYIYAGQTLWLPGAYLGGGAGYDVYIVARGDTLKALAARFGTSMDALGHLNGIANYNLIYEGQRLFIPGTSTQPTPPPPPPPSSGTYTVVRGDTLRKIADRLGLALADLIASNPQIRNANLIYAGQVIYLPGTGTLYTVVRGDTLKIIAGKFGTTVEHLLQANPQIWNANWIFAGQVIRIW